MSVNKRKIRVMGTTLTIISILILVLSLQFAARSPNRLAAQADNLTGTNTYLPLVAGQAIALDNPVGIVEDDAMEDNTVADDTVADDTVADDTVQNQPDSLPPTAVPDQYVIVWHDDPNRVNAAGEADRTSLAQTVELLDLSGFRVYNSAQSTSAILEEYRQNPAVKLIEPNYLYTISTLSASTLSASTLSAAIPNDPYVSEQWAWEKIRAYDAWDVTKGRTDTIIAIIDTGADLDHPDLSSKLMDGVDYFNDDLVPEDENGHGTHVAGLAAAMYGNDVGGVGACPNCQLLPLQASNATGTFSLVSIIHALDYAVQQDADVINMSFGGAQYSKILEDAVDYAWNNGAFLTCAAANDASSTQVYPAALKNCMAVAASTRADQRRGTSSFGDWIEVAAPGEEIFSTYLNGGYATANGTSFAAPHVAGLAGLLASQGLTNAQIHDRICDSADAIDGTGSDWTCGRINMLKAVDPSAGDPTPTPVPTDTLQPTDTPSPTDTQQPTSTPTPQPTNTATLTPTVTQVPPTATQFPPTATPLPTATPTVEPVVGCGPTITYDDVVNCSWNSETETHAYTFDAQDDDTFYFALFDDSPVGPARTVTIRPSNAEPNLAPTCFEVRNYSTLKLYNCRISENGPHTITLSIAGGNPQTKYRFWLRKLNDRTDTVPIAYGETVNGELPSEFHMDVYRFAGQAGDIARITLTDDASDQNWRWISIFNTSTWEQEFRCEETTGGSGVAEIGRCELSADAAYEIRVYDAFFNTPGAYTISLEKLPR